MNIEVIKNDDGSITIVKNKVKACDCSIEKVLSNKTKVEAVLENFDAKAEAQKLKIASDFELQMSKVKQNYENQLDEINDILLKAAEAGCVLPE